MDRDNIIPCEHVETPVGTSVEIAVDLDEGVLRSSGVAERRSGCYAGLGKGAGWSTVVAAWKWLKAITTAFNMFEMWSAVSSKLEHSATSSGSPLPLTSHAPQTPHTSSGSIKGNEKAPLCFLSVCLYNNNNNDNNTCALAYVCVCMRVSMSYIETLRSHDDDCIRDLRRKKNHACTARDGLTWIF